MELLSGLGFVVELLNYNTFWLVGCSFGSFLA
jgi:hypothetical protein